MKPFLPKSLFFLLMVTLFVFPMTVKAQENLEIASSVTPTPTPKIIKYDLAYPGILPDHPLYKLKVLRDKITAAVISDPRKKIDFYLLQTDKGILASAMLVDKGKIDLAIQTALKAEHNYTLIGQEIYRLRQLPDDSFFKKLRTASLKHQEILRSLAKRVPKDQQKTFLTVIDFSKRNWKTIEEYKLLEDEESMERVKQQEEILKEQSE